MKDYQFCMILLGVCYMLYKFKSHFLLHIWKWTKTGSTLILTWYNLGHNRHHNVQFWKHMKNCQFGMILQRVHYHVEIPFPVLHRKRNSHKGSKPVHLIPVIFVSCLLTFECVRHFLICSVPLYSHLYLFRMCLSINS